MKKIIIAIDGHSSSGKSTMAKDLAREIGYTYIDTGAMYRAVTLYSMQSGILKDGCLNEEMLENNLPSLEIRLQYNPSTGRQETYLNGMNVEKQIRSMAVSENVSRIAALTCVRKALVKQQQEMGKLKGIVMDGRDIGTVVFPQAELKIFVTASPEVRARRRVEELTAKGESVSYEEVLANVTERDFIDSNRSDSPLRQAEDALVLDNSDISVTEQKAWLLKQYEKKVKEING